MTHASTRYPCPCCGYLVFERPPGSFATCPICIWEDDNLQLEFATTLGGGANKVTLRQAQANFVELGACDRSALRLARRPGPADERDPGWRPIDPRVDTFEDFSDRSHRRAPGLDERLYYWRPVFWRRGS